MFEKLHCPKKVEVKLFILFRLVRSPSKGTYYVLQGGNIKFRKSSSDFGFSTVLI